MAFAFCPECDRRIDLRSHPRKGQLVTCPSCGAELEVINVDPLELDWAYVEPEEDWEEDWEEEEYWEEWEDETA